MTLCSVTRPAEQVQQIWQLPTNNFANYIQYIDIVEYRTEKAAAVPINSASYNIARGGSGGDSGAHSPLPLPKIFNLECLRA